MSSPHESTWALAARGPRDGEGGSPIEIWARSELNRSVYRPVRRVTCEYRDGVLTLRGRVPSFYQMQIALSLLRNVRDQVCIRNRLEVPLS